ncbi:MAG: 4Fe-4S cluster-binding domain-containing protein [bacterium]
MEELYFQEDTGLIINLFVTGKCNARCCECVNQTIRNNSNLDPSALELNVERDVKIIKRILKKHDNLPATLCFYGGEPLLEPHKFIPLIKALKDDGYGARLRYMVYTNGEMLAQFFREYPQVAQDIWIYAVSIDGDEVQHNRFRIGTDLKRIRENLKIIKKNYQGHILMWSTLREEQSLRNCFGEFIDLYRNGLVNHFFWHWLETPEEFKDFHTYSENYIADLKKIVDYYIKQLMEGMLLPIAHLNELILYLITKKERNHTACGLELSTNYDLLGGEILGCVDLPFEPGKILKKELNGLLALKDMLGCHQCNIHFYCGLRCPVQILHGAEIRTKQYCELLRKHIQVVAERLSDIKDLLKANNISLQDIYSRSAFIVRYTDVTP